MILDLSKFLKSEEPTFFIMSLLEKSDQLRSYNYNHIAQRSAVPHSLVYTILRKKAIGLCYFSVRSVCFRESMSHRPRSLPCAHDKNALAFLVPLHTAPDRIESAVFSGALIRFFGYEGVSWIYCCTGFLLVIYLDLLQEYLVVCGNRRLLIISSRNQRFELDPAGMMTGVSAIRTWKMPFSVK